MAEQEKTQALTGSLKSYFNTSCRLILLKGTERASVIGAGMTYVLFMLLAGFFFLLCLTFMGGYYFSDLLGNSYAGFAVVAGFYLLVLLILAIGRKKLVMTPVRDMIVRAILASK